MMPTIHFRLPENERSEFRGNQNERSAFRRSQNAPHTFQPIIRRLTLAALPTRASAPRIIPIKRFIRFTRKWDARRWCNWLMASF